MNANLEPSRTQLTPTPGVPQYLPFTKSKGELKTTWFVNRDKTTFLG